MDHYKDGFDPARFLEQMEDHPAFLTSVPEDSDELPPLVAALQSLRYEEDDPDACAFNYKEDGNVNYKAKKFRWAVECYDKALQLKVTKPDLIVALYWNRAVANFQLKNYRRTIKDCCEVLKRDAKHVKACYKGAQCLHLLEKFPEATLWIDNGLKIDETNREFLELKAKNDESEKKQIRNDRIRQREEKKIETLRQAIASRKITLNPENPWDGDHLAQTPSGATVYQKADSSLVWPVRLLFPEVDQQEFLDQVEEGTSLEDVLRLVLEENPPPWDTKKIYRTANTRCFFCDSQTKALIYEVGPGVSLGEVLGNGNYCVQNGLPGFIVLCYDSKFCRDYLTQFEKVIKITE